MAEKPAPRRIVTGHDAAGKAVVLSDAPNPHRMAREEQGVVSYRLWMNERTPAEMTGDRDRGATPLGIAPPPAGGVFRVVDFAPMSEGEIARLDAAHMARSMGGDHAAGKARPPRHPFMHRTRSLDYAIIIAGEIDMLLDDAEVHLRAGDCVVQQGTNHAWVNRGKETCRIAFVLIDAAEPLG